MDLSLGGACLVTFMLAATGASRAVEPDQTREQLMALISKPGYALMMRHALAPKPPGVSWKSDPPDWRLDDCASQRSLSEEGREQARRIGVELTKAGFRATNVFTSQWCRTRETAELLGLGPVRTMPQLNMFFPEGTENAAAHTKEKARATRANVELERLLTKHAGKGRILLVTHSGNIAWLTRGEEIKSGAMAVLKLDRRGKHRVMGTLHLGGD